MRRVQGEVERLDTGGRALGWVGMLCSAALVVLWLTRLDDPLPVPLLTGSVLAGLLFWAAIVRPAVLVDDDHLVLRNLVSTTRIPLAGIEGHVLRQVLAVRAGDRKHVGTGVGRSLRSSALGQHGQGRLGQPGLVGDVGDLRGAVRGEGGTVDAADFVEARLSDLCADARTRARVEKWSPEQQEIGRTTRRTTTWPVVAALAVSLLVFVLSFRL